MDAGARHRVTHGAPGDICVCGDVNNKHRPSPPSLSSPQPVGRDGCDGGDVHCLLLWSGKTVMASCFATAPWMLSIFWRASVRWVGGGETRCLLLRNDLAVNHKAREVRQARGDAFQAFVALADPPTHPARGGGVNRLLEVQSPSQAVVYVVGKVASVAAVQEGANAVEGLAGGLGNRAGGQGLGVLGVLLHRAPKTPGFVLRGGDVLLGHGVLRDVWR